MMLLADLLFDPGGHSTLLQLFQQALQPGLPQSQHVEDDRRVCR